MSAVGMNTEGSAFADADARAAARDALLERRDLFAFPVYSARVHDAEHLNRRLRELALQWERREPGVTVTNRGAYHSRQTLLESAEPAVRQLRAAILSTYAQIRQAFHHLDASVDWAPSGLEGWVNVNRAGSHFIAHTHLGQGWHWSGVYYVSTPAAPAGEGRLVFEHRSADYNLGPRPIAATPHAGGCGAVEFGLDAQEGALVFFPSSLFHRVEAFSGPGERISIAFNIRDPQLQWTYPSPAAARVRPEHWLRHYFLGLYLPLKGMKDFLGSRRRIASRGVRRPQRIKRIT